MADDPKDRKNKHTVKGFGAPTGFDDDATAVTLPPFIEVELVYETGHQGMSTENWQAFEVWTQNRIYITDWGMCCIEVLERKTSKPDPKHPLLGSYLAGGQRQDDDYLEMTFPCPRPGTEAVFEYRGIRKGYVNTSTVTRVVMRLRVLEVPRERAVPTWDSITSSGRFSAIDGKKS